MLIDLLMQCHDHHLLLCPLAGSWQGWSQFSFLWARGCNVTYISKSFHYDGWVKCEESLYLILKISCTITGCCTLRWKERPERPLAHIKEFKSNSADANQKLLVNVMNMLAVSSLQLFPFALEQRVNVSVNLTSLMSHLTKERPCLQGPQIIRNSSQFQHVCLWETWALQFHHLPVPLSKLCSMKASGVLYWLHLHVAFVKYRFASIVLYIWIRNVKNVVELLWKRVLQSWYRKIKINTNLERGRSKKHLVQKVRTDKDCVWWLLQWEGPSLG